MPSPLSIFLSHSWGDKVAADQLYQELQSALASELFTLWMDSRAMQAGDRLNDQITAQMDRSDIVVLLWSSHAASPKGFVLQEIEMAVAKGLPVIPCVLEFQEEDGRLKPSPSLPECLADCLYIDYAHGVPLRTAALLSKILMEEWQARWQPKARPGNDPRQEVLTELKHYLDCLRAERDPSNRDYWIRQSCRRIRDYAHATGDAQSVQKFVMAAMNSNEITASEKSLIADALAHADETPPPLPDTPNGGKLLGTVAKIALGGLALGLAARALQRRAHQVPVPPPLPPEDEEENEIQAPVYWEDEMHARAMRSGISLDLPTTTYEDTY